MSVGSNPSVVIRCDGSPQIGSGHVTRCRALAHALRAEAVEPVFAMQTLGGEAAASVRRDGFEVSELPPRPPNHLGMDDARRTSAIARRLDAAVVVVDHYGADAAYFSTLVETGLEVAVIDDRDDRDVSLASWLLNQNLSAPEFAYAARPGATVLLGTRYALLRPEFTTARKRLRRSFSADDRRVLITFGGGDTADVAATAVRAIGEIERRLSVDVVVGEAQSAVRDLEEAVDASHHDVRLLHRVENMAELMAAADLSINAGGSTCWELMCLGVPMLVTSLSPDQRLNQAPLAAAGVAVHVPYAELALITTHLEPLLTEADRRRTMSACASELVDGEGASRAAASLARILTTRSEVVEHAGH